MIHIDIVTVLCTSDFQKRLKELMKLNLATDHTQSDHPRLHSMQNACFPSLLENARLIALGAKLGLHELKLVDRILLQDCFSTADEVTRKVLEESTGICMRNKLPQHALP